LDSSKWAAIGCVPRLEWTHSTSLMAFCCQDRTKILPMNRQSDGGMEHTRAQDGIHESAEDAESISACAKAVVLGP